MLRKNKPVQQAYYVTPFHDGCIDTELLDLALYEPFTNKLTAILGRCEDIPIYLDLEDAPHVLIAGSTKSGKSVCITTILQSLLLKNNPDEMEIYIIDPKKVDYISYNIPHVRGYTSGIEPTATMLQSIYDIMMQRFELLQTYRVKNINELQGYKLSNIIIVFDEFASFSSKEGKKTIIPVLQDILRLGRACGIHVILATQRPDRTIIDGQMKSNCSCRIAFRLPSVVDSRTILDCKGAELLKGKGDGILINSDGTKTRFQGFMCSNQQEKYLLNYWKNQPYVRNF